METELECLLRGFTVAERQQVLALGHPQPFGAGEVILSAGRFEWDIHVVQEGEVSVYAGNVRLGDLRPGQTLGTAALLYPQIQWSAVRGRVDGTLLRISREDLMSVFDALPRRRYQQFCINIFRVWVDVLRQRNERIVDIQRRIFSAYAAGRKRRFRLLIASEQSEALVALQQFLTGRYDVRCATDGAEVLAQAAADQPDLVVLNLSAAGLDNAAVCRRLKTDPRTEHVPVVVIAPDARRATALRSGSHGADACVCGPLDLQDLGDTVGAVLERQPRGGDTGAAECGGPYSHEGGDETGW